MGRIDISNVEISGYIIVSAAGIIASIKSVGIRVSFGAC